MADKRITDLPLILSGDITSNDVLPIVNIDLDITNKVEVDQLKSYILNGVNDYYVTGGTYSGGTLVLDRQDGSVTITGFTTGDTNTFLTAATYNDLTNTITLTDNVGTNFDIYINSVSGLTVNGVLSATTISATTLYGDGSNLTGISSGTNLSKTLFVDPNGNDSTAVKGDLHKPYQNIYAAKSAATSGDTIYVLPGTWTYDNTNAAGNPYNGQIDTLVNLWKDGISYYFSVGTTIWFYNQTVTGENMYLFKPIGVNTTCIVRGGLIFSGTSIGVDTSNGAVQYFIGNSDDNGFTFDSETKIISTTSNPIQERLGTTTGQTATIKIYSDEINYTHLADNVGQSQAPYGLNLYSIPPTNYYVKARKSTSNGYGFLRCRSLTSSSNVFVDIDEVIHNGDPAGFYAIQLLNNSSPNIYLNFKKLSYRGGLWAIENNLSTFNAIINANLFESNTSVRVSPTYVVSLGSLTFNGTSNINFNNRTLFENNGNFTLNLNCDIIPTISNYTNTLIKQLSTGVTNFKGNIGGNFQGQVAVCRNGKLNIKNSSVSSNLTGGVVLSNDTTSSTGTTSISNSTIILSGSSNLINGQYSKNYILNSNIRNSGSGNLFVNTTSTGSLQIHNSTLQSVSGSTINITGSAPLTISNSTSNTNISAATLNGSVTILTELDIL